MAKPIVWANKARKDLFEILEYWVNRNKSKTYSIKLNFAFEKIIETIAEHPKIGKLSGYNDIRFGILKPYLIAYQEFKSEILIITIWDTRQDPEKLKKIIS
jgi:plasmid stabilization system protein ParE